MGPRAPDGRADPGPARLFWTTDRASFDGTERWVEHLLTYPRMGFTEVTLRITSRDQERQSDRLVGEVLPALEAPS